MKVKICGLISKEDAVWALNYGADFLGFNFSKESPRHVSSATASKWIKELPAFSSKVGVFVNAGQKDILDTVISGNLNGVQLHGDETPDFVKALRSFLEGIGRKTFIMKAVRVKDEESLSALSSYVDVVDYFLLDSFVPDQAGGTGVRFNWDVAVRAKELGKPIFLAGGLNPENVKEAVKKVGPFAVDVASGVEKSPRKKDADKIKAFVHNAKNL